MRPRIGVLPLYNSEKQTLWINPLYFGGVEQAGGMPLLLSLTEDPSLWEEFCQSFDGFVFTGGQDVDPGLYGQEKIPQCDYQAPLRDNQEFFMIRRLRELDKPVLGICRGIQVINASLGGTLYQDLPAQRPSPVIHRQDKPYDIPHHQVDILPGSQLHRITGHTRLSVNSMHHQALWETAPGFTATAAAEDGITEAIECPDARFFLGVQWHPEHMWMDYASGRAIWSAFVNACK